MNKTICAISTPLGQGAISIVRLSGGNSLSIMRKLFSSKSLDYSSIKPRYLYLGNLDLGDGAIEHCLAVYFKAPFSYTGEDMVEFQLHGGSLLTQKVLNLLLENGASLAEAGEFTKRAFENGKISLDMAESIIGEINAESEGELKASLSLAEGKLNKKALMFQARLTELLAEIEATLDYPEEDFEMETKDRIFAEIEDIAREIVQLVEDSKMAKILKSGIDIALVGAPNVGKSSTLNALIGEERAIVTDIEGTTRDTLSESIIYRGIKFNFIDTAGIRDSEDVVEKLGIEKSKKSIERADVVLFLLDGSKNLSEYDRQIEELLHGKSNVIRIVNKIDLKRVLSPQENEISISALSDININEIKEAIWKLTEAEKIDYNRILVTSARQIESLEDALEITQDILSSQEKSMDIIAMLIKSLWSTLGKITGECENEDIVDLIFSKFCLGK